MLVLITLIRAFVSYRCAESGFGNNSAHYPLGRSWVKSWATGTILIEHDWRNQKLAD